MIKSFGLLKRKKGITREQFLDHWENVHAPLFLSREVPGLRNYIQHHAVKAEGPESDSDVDGIAELWFDDAESARAFDQWLRYSDEAKDQRDDTVLYVDLEARLPVIITEEHTPKKF